MNHFSKIIYLTIFLNLLLSNQNGFLKDQFLFCLNSNVNLININEDDTFKTGIPELDSWLKYNNVLKIEQWLPIARENDHSGSVYLNRIYKAKLNNSKDVKKLVNEIQELPFIHSAELMYPRIPFYTPNDPQYNSQWFLDQVNANQGWDFWNIQQGELPGDPNIILASVDTGVDWDHPDLIGNIWQNLGEDADGDGHTIEYINGQWVLDPGDLNQIDDDNHDNDPATLIDDLIGWDCSGYNGDQDNDPRPGSGGGWSHGTHVAGLLNSSTDNNLGISSVAFNSNVMSVKVSRESQQGQIFITEGYLGILYAAQAGHGAGSFAIINNSWGGIGYNAYEQDVINVCHNQYKAIVLAAAGNGDGGELYGTHYPSSYDNVISVTALGSNDNWNHWANYHETVDISAPGENIRSTVINNYSTWSGTSMATPIVASCIGLLQAFRPEWSSEQLGTMIIETANPIIYSINSETYLEGTLGSGRVDVLQALVTELYPKLELMGYDLEIINNNDGTISPGDELHLFLVIYNEDGWGNANNISVNMNSMSDNINIINGLSNFPNINSDEAAINESIPFILNLDSDFEQDSLILNFNIQSNENDNLFYENDISLSFPVFYDSIFGDLNNDNNVNILDVMIVINLILDNVNPNDSDINADLNDDNTFDILDIVVLLNLIIE